MFPLGNVSKIKKIFGGFMKSVTKKVAIAGLGAACVVSLSLFTGILAKNNGVANADGNNAPDATDFFYDYLLDVNNNEYTLAKKFYEALEEINQAGDFKKGVVDYPINNIVTSAQLKSWVEDGNLEVPRAFSAARDSFLTDHPEIFYVDFYKLTISVGRSGGSYLGFINSGREANVFYDNGFNTAEQVAEAIVKYNQRIDEIIKKANDLEAADEYTARDAYLAKEVNRILTEEIKYDYVAYQNQNDPNYIAAAYINTSYGGLVEGKAVCGGYSTSYKVIMDKLGIPCITVNGYTNNKDQNGNNAENSVYHMWNYVWLEVPEAQPQSKARAAENKSNWYSVDVTWDYSATNKYRYALLNKSSDELIHVNDGVISSSGYKLRYPSLSKFNYGSTGETDGLQYSRVYTPLSDGSTDDNGNPLVVNYSSVSYNGKSAKRLLEEDGLYIVCRFANLKDGEINWYRWFSLEEFRKYVVLAMDRPDEMMQDNGIETRFYDNTSAYFTQFAVFDYKPDAYAFQGEEITKFYYSDEVINKNNSMAIGEPMVNHTYGTYTPPPYVQSSTPSYQVEHTISDNMREGSTPIMAESKAFEITVTYDEELHILDETKPIGVHFVSEHPNAQKYAKFYKISKELDANGNEVYAELIKAPKNSGDSTMVYNTIRFKFAPSLMYEHNSEDYNIYFTNVGSAKIISKRVNGELIETTSDKLPNPANFSFGRLYMACPAVFNYDGRLWIDCCAQPTLVTNSDLSAMDFKDEDDNSTFSENQRSQMMLVAEKANTETVNTMLDEITDSDAITVNKDDIKTTQTYDIRLQICNKYPVIPDGSYVKIALGFPENYGPEDEGVTFKLFHRKHDKATDTYTIEEVPCVVTQFGIVATVTSFSPYMVAVVDADKATDKTIYASIEGKGGTLSKQDGKIISLKEGGTHTYTIKPNDGYQIYSVKLNGVDVASRIENDKLTLGYEELGTNNELVIQYIANEAAARIQQKIDDNVIDQDVEVTKYVVAVADQPVYPDFDPIVTPNAKAGSNKTVIIVVTVVCVALAVAASVTVTVIALRKKRKQ